jgi:uncharacterized membrane protein YhhN
MQMVQNRNVKYFFTVFTGLIASLAILFNALENKTLFIVFKPLTTLLIILITVLFGQKKNSFTQRIFLGLCFCLLGDTLLLFEAYFLWGLVAFLVAHLCFSWSFIAMGGFKFYLLPLLILLGVGGTYFFILYDSLGSLKIPVAVYLVVIIFMSWQGVCLRIREKDIKYTMIAIAVVLFLLSDGLLAWARFKASFPISGVLILASYWSSLLLIALSTSQKAPVCGTNEKQYLY